MRDERKTKVQLIVELEELRARLAGLEAEAADRQPAPGSAAAGQPILHRAFHYVRDAVLVLDDELSTIVACNPGATEVFGYAERELVGAAPSLIQIDEAHLHAFRKKLFPAIARDNCLFLDAFEMRRQDGSRFWTEHLLVPLEDEGETTRGWIWVIRDISERRQLEGKLLHAQKMEAIGTLAGGVAHEINNVLAVVIGLGSVLLKELDPDDQQHRDVREIVNAARRGSVVTRNLLGFARQTSTRKQRLQLRDVVTRVTELLARSLPKQITVDAQLEHQLADVEADPDQLSQVLMDLSLNAVEAMPEGGRLRITTGNAVLAKQHLGAFPELEPGHYVRLQVIDDGRGMDEATRVRVFEPFFTTKGVGEGTGLGLATAYGVVKAHHGAVTIDSTPGEGSTVTILLPAYEPQAAKDEVERPRGSSGTVLVVDDEEMIRILGERLLSKLGYEAILADGGEQAVRIFEASHQRIDAVMLDLAMPGMDGFACFKHLKAIDRNVRVVVCTGFGSGRTAERLLSRGARAFVSKPFDIDQLRDALELVS